MWRSIAIRRILYNASGRRLPPSRSIHALFTSNDSIRQQRPPNCVLRDSFKRQRCQPFSSAADRNHADAEDRNPENDQEDLERFTHILLQDSRSIPLGTMDVVQLDAALVALQAWSQSNTGFGLDTAHRVLERLLQEYAATTLYRRRHLQPVLLDWQWSLLHAWLHEDLSQSPLALQRAESLLRRLILYGTEQIPWKEFQVLVHAWLHVPSFPEAARLLLWWTSLDTVVSESEPDCITFLIEYFHFTLDQLLELESTPETQNLLESLVERVHSLQTQPGWENIRLHEHLQDRLTQASGIAEPATELSPDRVEELARQALDLIAGEDPVEIETIVNDWNALPGTPDMPVSLLVGITDYYIERNLAKPASHWLQRLEATALHQSETPASFELISTVGKRMYRVFRLWCECKDDREAPWRADEIVQRLEVLEAQRPGNSGKVPDKTYKRLCNLWLASGDPAAMRKVHAITARFTGESSSDTGKTPQQATTTQQPTTATKPEPVSVRQPKNSLEVALQAAAMDESVSVEHVHKLCKELKSRWKEMDPVEVSHCVEAAMRAIGERGMFRASERLIRDSVQNGVKLSSVMTESAFDAMKSTNNSNHAVRTLDFLERHTTQLSLATYYKALRCSLLYVNKRTPQPDLDKRLQIVRRVVNRILKNDLDWEISALAELFRMAIARLTYNHRTDDALAVLRLGEKLMESKIKPPDQAPLEPRCFNMVANQYAELGDLKRVEEIFNRLRAYHEEGYASMVPNQVSFSIYLKALVKGNNSALARAVMDDMIQLYESTGNSVCQPDLGIFHCVLRIYGNASTRETAEMSVALLDEIVRVGCTPHTYTVGLIVRNCINGAAHGAFSLSNRLHRRMKELDLEIEVPTLNSLLWACGHFEETQREEALLRATDLFGQIRVKGANAISYRNFGTAIGILLPRTDKRRDQLLSTALELCCKDGCLSPLLVKQFQRSMNKADFQRLYTNRLNADGLEPPEWSAKARIEDEQKSKRKTSD